MFAILVHIRPLDLKTKTRVDVFVASTAGAAYQGLGGFVWESAISRRPRATVELFALDLGSGIRAAQADFEIALGSIKEVNANGLYWSGAPVVMYRADSMAWPAPVEFRGVVSNPVPNLATGRLVLNCKVSSDDIDTPLLVSEFTGGGGLGGDPDLRGTLKPAGFGRCLNVAPVFFDLARNIGMLDGYGNLQLVDWLGEGLSTLGPSVGDFADYAALAAAIDNKTIPPGRWGTSIASGLIGLGAPPVGKITCHCRFGSGMTGALIRRIVVTHAKLSEAFLELDSLTALDRSVPYPVHYWTAEQITVKTLIEDLAAGCNASPVITLQNKLALVRVFNGISLGKFTRNGFSEPAVTDWQTRDFLKPTWQMKARVARPVSVLTTDEVNYADTVINRGVYDPAETYRQGNTVWTDDGAQWLYRNAVAAAGHAPPINQGPDANGDIADAYWERMKAPTAAQLAQAYKTAAPLGMGPYKKGDIVQNQGAQWIFTADITWDGTPPPALPAQSNAFWTIVKDATTITLKSNVAAIVVLADYTNTPKSGQLPANGRGILTVGSVDASAAATWAVATSGCTAAIAADGSFQITDVSASGYLDIKATYGGTTYTTRVTVTLSAGAAPAGGGGSGATTVTITTFPSVNATTYPSAPNGTAVIASGSAGINFSLSLNYSASSTSNGKVSRTATLIAKIVYRVNGSGSGWTDVAGEVTGTEASSGAFPEYETYDGVLDVNQGLSGIIAGTVYEFGVLLRRTGASPTTPTGALTARQAT